MTEPPRVFVTGATGFVGRAVVARLLGDGRRVTVASRKPDSARVFGPDVDVVGWDAAQLSCAVSGCEAVLHLAGESISGRWPAAKKERIRRSRVEGTRRLVDAMAQAAVPPKALVSTSAVGFYGHRERPVSESDGPGEGFLADVCACWEAEAARAEEFGVRVAILRLGVVLGRGGAVGAMFTPARLGLLGRLGSGDQAVPWIHLDDVAQLFVAAAFDARFRGSINAVAGAVPQRDFARLLARAVGRPTGPPVPGWAVRLGLGEAAALVLDSSPVVCRRSSELGLEFIHPDLEAALQAVVSC